MSFDATFWVAVSFIIFFVALIYFKIPKKINDLLSNMIADIKKEIDESEKLRMESKKLLEGQGKLTQGKFTSLFESEYSDYVGTKHAIATNSCTAGLDAIFRSLNIKGKEIIIRVTDRDQPVTSRQTPSTARRDRDA